MKGRQKNRLLAVGLIILALMAYQFSFKKTLELGTSINKLELDKAQLENANGRIQYLQQQNAYLDSILQLSDMSTEVSFDQILLQKLNKISEDNKVQISSYDQPHIYTLEGGTIQTYTIEVKGDFRNLMLFSSSLEKQRLGKFSSVAFEKKKNFKTRRNQLSCKITLQRLSK